VAGSSNNVHTVEVMVVNSHGLHARPVMRFVDTAIGFTAEVTVDKGEGTEQVDGKDPMRMMLLAAPKGTKLRIMAHGDDAQAALEALAELVNGGFAEE
jgi:phosphotransferase system HPr (HPr) family protein